MSNVIAILKVLLSCKANEINNKTHVVISAVNIIIIVIIIILNGDGLNRSVPNFVYLNF